MSKSKKYLPVAIVGMLFSSQLSANFAREYCTQEDHKRAEKVVASCEEKCYTNKGVFVTLDYLLWHANECGLAYGVTVDNLNHRDGKVNNIHFEWDSGYRIGLGYRLPHDKWNLSVTLTGFSTDADGDFTTQTDLLFPEWTSQVLPTSSNLITKISGRWDLNLHLLDGEIARYFYVTSKLGFKPHFGIRGAWIDQNYHANAIGGITASQSRVAKDEYRMNNRFAGVGFRAGLDTQWDFGRRFSIYGNASYSLIYGSFELRAREELQIAGSSEFPVQSIRDSFQQIVSIAELGLGLRWIYTFDNCWAIRFQAGWEFNAFFGQNKLEHFGFRSPTSLAFIANNEDLTTQGFVLSGRMDF